MPSHAQEMAPSAGVVEHPAVTAWQSTGLARGVPRAIEPLKVRKNASGKSAVYRLEGIGPDGKTLVAKRCKRVTSATERLIYEEILPCVDVRSTRYFGHAEDPDPEFCWLFLEHIDGEPFSAHLSDHRRRAARWLACLHTSAETMPALLHLPNRGVNYYQSRLRLAQMTLERSILLGVFQTIKPHLESLLLSSEAVISTWERIEQRCAALPVTLAHGDFVAKNVRVQLESRGAALIPFDWETGGRGVPVADLVNLDQHLYWEQVRPFWPSLTLADIQGLVTIGHLFRTIVSIYWTSLSLPYGGSEKAIAQVRLYDRDRLAVVRALELRR